jgi:hypothetical protein
MSFKNLICIACLTLCFATIVYGKQPEVQITGIFSSFKYNQEGGDLLGIEVFICYGGGGEYWLLFQESNGEPNTPQLVKASVSGETIQFTISESTVSADGKVDGRNRTFKGRITKAQITGSFSDSKETIKLPRKKSYWQ